MGAAQGMGSALRAVLKARGCALGADEARALAVSLIDLICSGLIVAGLSARLPRASNTGQSICIEDEK